jgi:predicted transcriptional regulator
VSLFIGDLSPVTRRLDALAEGQKRIMSAITDWAAKEQADLSAISATLDGIAAGILNLDQMIQRLQNSPGPLGPDDQAALDAISGASKNLATKASSISVTPPGQTSTTA